MERTPTPDAPFAPTNGKAPAASAPEPSNVGFRPSNGGGLVKVQPPRPEDLQPSYAHTVDKTDNPDAHGWYASMSKSA